MPIQFMQGIETWTFSIRQGGPSGFLGNFQHSNSQDQTYTFPDKSGTVALLSDISNISNPEGLQVLSQTVNNGIASPPSYIQAFVKFGNTKVFIGGSSRILAGLDSVEAETFIGDLQGTADNVAVIPKLSGDVDSNDNIVSLKETGVTPGTYNDSPSSLTPFTVDAKGRITAIGESIDIGSSESVTLSQAMAALTCFRIGSNGKAFTVTTNDSIIPMVDGLTLEAGGIGDTVSVARIKNKPYEIHLTQNSYVLYWLTSTGIISSVRPPNDVYQVLVGRSIPNSNTLIFDPQLPLKLAN